MERRDGAESKRLQRALPTRQVNRRAYNLEPSACTCASGSGPLSQEKSLGVHCSARWWTVL